MRIAKLSLLLLLVLPGLHLAQQNHKPAPNLPNDLTPDQVRDRLGAPLHISRQVHAQRCLEQWHYGPPDNLRLVFDCPRGQVPRLIQKRPVPARAP
jgi:hypothetical protein